MKLFIGPHIKLRRIPPTQLHYQPRMGILFIEFVSFLFHSLIQIQISSFHLSLSLGRVALKLIDYN